MLSKRRELLQEFNWLSGFVFPYINFVIFLIILLYSSKKSAQKLALKRKEDYENLFREAQAAKEASDKELEFLRERFKNLEVEISKMQANYKKTSQNEVAAIKASAEKMVHQIQEESKRISQNEIANAQKQLTIDLWEKTNQALVEKFQQEFKEEKTQSYTKKALSGLQQLS